MASRRGPHVRELFIASGPLSAVGFEYEQKESKQKYKISSKANRAPPPPKLGQYKPKILQSDASSNIPLTNNISASDNISTSHNRQDDKRINAFIIGDKDVPMVLHPFSSDHGDSDEVKAQLDRDAVSSNPLFNTNSLPVLSRRVSRTSTSSSEYSYKNETDDVYIPAPDYDEDEMTLKFDPENDHTSNKDEKSIYKEYDGEDFAKYLPDDSLVGPSHIMSWSGRKPPSHTPLQLEKKHKTEVKRSRYKKRNSATSGFQKDKFQSNRKGSLRHFSFADSKLSAIEEDGNERSMKWPTGGTTEARSDPESYEVFLHSRHRGMGGSNLSHSEPMWDGPVDSGLQRHSSKKDSVWKKLTWKLKRHVGGFVAQ